MDDAPVDARVLEMDEPPSAVGRVDERALVGAVDARASLREDDPVLVGAEDASRTEDGLPTRGHPSRGHQPLHRDHQAANRSRQATARRARKAHAHRHRGHLRLPRSPPLPPDVRTARRDLSGEIPEGTQTRRAGRAQATHEVKAPPHFEASRPPARRRQKANAPRNPLIEMMILVATFVVSERRLTLALFLRSRTQ